MPSGAAGLPKALPLLHTPPPAVNCQGVPLGEYWYEAAAIAGTSKLPSLIEPAVDAIATSSMKAVLSPPSGFRPTIAMLCIPPLTVKFAVWYSPKVVPSGVTMPIGPPSIST